MGKLHLSIAGPCQAENQGFQGGSSRLSETAPSAAHRVLSLIDVCGVNGIGEAIVGRRHPGAALAVVNGCGRRDGARPEETPGFPRTRGTRNFRIPTARAIKAIRRIGPLQLGHTRGVYLIVFFWLSSGSEGRTLLEF